MKFKISVIIMVLIVLVCVAVALYFLAKEMERAGAIESKVLALTSRVAELEARPRFVRTEPGLLPGIVGSDVLYVNNVEAGPSPASCAHEWVDSKYYARPAENTPEPQLYTVGIVEQSCHKCGTKREIP